MARFIHTYRKLSTGAFILFFFLAPSLASAAVIDQPFSLNGSEITFQNLITSNLGRGDGHVFLWAWNGSATTTTSSAYGTTYDNLGNSWSSSGLNVWTVNLGCSLPSNTTALCDFTGNSLFAPVANSLPAGTYMIEVQDTTYSGGDDYFYGPITWTGSVIAEDTSTRVIATTPTSGTTISSSSPATLGADIFVNDADYTSGMSVEVRYARYSDFQAAVASPDLLFVKYVFPITASGETTYSTTTPLSLRGGQYTMVTTIRDHSFIDDALNFLGFGQFANVGIKTSTTTQFVVGELSGYDRLVASTTASLSDYLASSTISLASCSAWTSFNLGDCLNLIFVPQSQPIIAALDNFKNTFLTYAPWGYLTRTVVILSGNAATSSLPTFSTTIALGSPTDTDTFTFNMQDMVAGGGALLNSIPARGSSMNVQDIIEPWLRLFLAVSIIFIIVHDLTKMGGGSHNFHSARSKGQV